MFTKKTRINVLADLDENKELDFLTDLSGSGYDWHEHETEGQLAVDVAHTPEELIIVATMAGAVPENIGLHLHNDLLTIRGTRRSPIQPDADHFHQETYWGKFSRTIVLPSDVKYEFAQAKYKNGVLEIRLPKRNTDSKIPILVIDD